MVVIVVSVLVQQRANGVGVIKLCEMFGVSLLTVVRWLSYFREVYPHSGVWQIQRGRFMPPVVPDTIPLAVVDRFMASRGDPLAGLVRCVSLLSGVSGT